MSKNTNKRIIFIDLMRAIAVLMMVQGHTIDALLAPEFRSFESFAYSIWHTLRGFTAPVFMFSAGTAFTYLLFSKGIALNNNPRVKKGFIRFLTLVGIGYLLRYPTYTIVDFSQVTETQWRIFFTVDALHLIGFGILFVLLTAIISEKIKAGGTLPYAFAAIFFFGGFFLIKDIPMTNYLPEFFAAYFNYSTGSLFPLFPWAGYVLAGAVLGKYLAENPSAPAEKIFAAKTAFAGLAIISLSALVYFGGILSGTASNIFAYLPSVIPFRLGIVLMLVSALSAISISINRIPALVQDIGKNTLLIYVVHLVIIYGSVISPGLNLLYGNKLSAVMALLTAAGMLVLMVSMVIGVGMIKRARKKKPAMVNA